MVKPKPKRRGAALLMTMFLVFMVSGLIVNILSTETLQLAATRNSIEYERSLYWANAGVHHAGAQLLGDPLWRGSVTEGVSLPGDPTGGYAVTVTDDPSGAVLVTSTGYAGQSQRTVQARIEL